MDPNQPNSTNPEQPSKQPPPQQPTVDTGAPNPVQGPVGTPPVYQQQKSDPGQGLTIASFILWFLGLAPIGLICAIVARIKTRNAGLPNSTAATVALILNAITSVVILFIVPLLVITTFSGIQMKARDSERKTDITSMHTELEVFFSAKGYYPSLEDLNDPAWRNANMSRLDTTALSDPSGTSSVLVATPTSNQYSYAPTDKNGTICTGTQAKCEHYTLTVNLESSMDGQKTYQKTDLR